MSTITEILGTDNPAASRLDLNANFAALNLDKVEKVGTDGVSITIADGANEVGLTITQNDVTNNKNAIVINTNVGALGTDTSQHALLIKSTDPGSIGPFIGFYHDSASPTTNDQPGGFGVFGKNSIGEQVNYGGFGVIILDTTDGSEDAVVSFYATRGGVIAQQVLSVNDGINGLEVGVSTAPGIVSSNGDQDLILKTGNATTGSITITDGANGNITLAPNGTGQVYVDGPLRIYDGIIKTNTTPFEIQDNVGTKMIGLSTTSASLPGTVELGHASDTTISRVSAGVIAVEGVNLVKENSNASAAEVNTGTSTTKFVTPDALAGSNLGIRYVQCALNGSTALTTGDVAYFRIPAALGGMNLVSVAASVGTGAAGSSSSGTPTFTVTNVTQTNAAMLSTALTVDANEYTSATAAVAAVIDTANDDVATNDLLKVAVTTAGTGVTYAMVTLGFQLP